MQMQNIDNPFAPAAIDGIPSQRWRFAIDFTITVTWRVLNAIRECRGKRDSLRIGDRYFRVIDLDYDYSEFPEQPLQIQPMKRLRLNIVLGADTSDTTEIYTLTHDSQKDIVYCGFSNSVAVRYLGEINV